ncbi:MAG: hypothetical protein WAL30_05345 [Candidatus Aquirickettsiella sp.]
MRTGTSLLGILSEKIVTEDFVNYIDDLSEFLDLFIEETTHFSSMHPTSIFFRTCLDNRSIECKDSNLYKMLINNSWLTRFYKFMQLAVQENKENILIEKDYTHINEIIYQTTRSNITTLKPNTTNKFLTGFYLFLNTYYQDPNFVTHEQLSISGAYDTTQFPYTAIVDFAKEVPSEQRDYLIPFLNALGRMGFNNFNNDRFLLDLEREVLDALKTFNLSEKEMGENFYSFLSKYRTNTTDIHDICTQLEVSACSPKPIVLSTTTKEPISTLNQNITSTADENISAQVNPTDANTPTQKKNHLSSSAKFGTAMGLAGCAGFLNGSSLVILHIAERKNCSITTRRLLAVTLALANSFTISTLPLIYSIVEDFSNDQNDSVINSQKLLTSTCAFFTSILLQAINVGVHYYVPNKSFLKNLVNFLPLLASLWMLANGEESVDEGRFILGITMITSFSVNAATQSAGIKLYSSFFSRPQNKTDQEQGEEEKLAIPSPDIVTDNTPKAETSQKTYQYISKEKLDEIKNLTNKLVLAKLKNIKNFLSNNVDYHRNQITSQTPPQIAAQYQQIIDDNSEVQEEIEKEIKSLEEYYDRLNDDIHEEAYTTHTERKAYVAAMEKLANVFKLMSPILNDLKNALSQKKGYIAGKQESFFKLINIKEDIDNLITSIGTLQSPIDLYLSNYNMADATEKAERKGKLQALANQKTFDENVDNTLLRQHNNNKSGKNRYCSMYSNNKGRSSGSDTSETANLLPTTSVI